MTLEGMEQAWKSQGFREIHGEVEEVIHRMQRSHRWQQALMTFCALMTLASTVAAGLMLSRPPSPGADNLWLLLSMQAIAIAATAWLVRMRARRQRNFVRWGMPVREAVIAALRDMQGQIREMKFVIGAGCLLLVLSAFAAGDLYDAGKMNSHAVTSFATLVFVIVATNAALLTRRYRRTLRPQSDRLRMILTELEG